MKNIKIVGAGTVAVTAVTALLLGAGSALADAEDSGGFGEAYAFAASGLIDVEETPYVESDGDLERDEILGLGERSDLDDAGVFIGLANVAAEAGKAETSVARVELLELLRADLIRTFCDGDEGGVEIVNGSVLGQDLPDSPAPSESFDASPLAEITFNNQTRNTDGSLTVTGLEVTLLPGRDDDENETLDAEDQASLPLIGDLLGAPELPTNLLTEQDVLDELTGPLGIDLSGSLLTLTFGSATCKAGEEKEESKDVDKDEDVDDSDDEDETEEPAGDAPPATVVEASLPVTG